MASVFYRVTVQIGSALDKEEDQRLYASVLQALDRAIWLLNNTRYANWPYCTAEFDVEFGERTIHFNKSEDEVYLTITEMKVHDQ